MLHNQGLSIDSIKRRHKMTEYVGIDAGGS